MYGGGNAAKKARNQEKQREARIDTGLKQIDATYSGFDDNFYKGREDAYLGTVTPHLNQQFDETRRNLSYSLARSGLTTSGAAIDKNASLNRELGNKQREVSDAALTVGNQTRGEVEQQRNQLVNQLNASGNPASIATGLTTSAANLRAPSPVGPIGNFFGDWTQTYLANQRARTADTSVQPMFSFGGNNQPSSTIVGGR